MSDVFTHLRGKAPDHTITTVLGTVISLYLSESPPFAVKDIVVLAIENQKDMDFTADQYVKSHLHVEPSCPNVSSVIAWEKTALQDKQYTLRLAFHFMNRFSLAQVVDSATFAKKQFPEPALQSLAVQMLNGLW